MDRRGFLRSLRSASAGALLPLSAAATTAAPEIARNWPDRPVRIVIPAPAGGGADFIARNISVALSEAWGQQVLIDPKPGGGGIISTSHVVKSAPDGYTLLGGYTYLIQMPAMRDNIPYDVYKDLIPITQLINTDDILAVSASLPVKNLDEFVKHVKANPNTFGLGSYGNGSSSHLHCELFRRQAQLDLTHVPFPGGAPLLQALLGGHIASGFPDISGSRIHLKNERMRVLASTGRRRTVLTPDVPTFTELGYTDFEPSGFMGLFAPAGTPMKIVNKISSDVRRLIVRPDIAQRYMEAGLTPKASSPSDFVAMMREDAKVWTGIAKASSIRIDS